MYVCIYIYIHICNYEELTRLAETRLAQSTLSYLNISILRYLELIFQRISFEKEIPSRGSQAGEV